MKKVSILPMLVLSFSVAAIACARTAEPSAAAASTAIEQSSGNQSAATAVQSFTPVEGADLAGRLEAASARARSGQSPYWSAYSFDVRPGVAVDPGIRDFHGSMNTIGDTSVFVGTTASGVTVETRNLAIFLLRQPGNNQMVRMEVYNLERKREYSGYPVYWLGRANNEESINFLRGLSDSTVNLLGERAVLGIALHDDSRVANLLKEYVRTSTNLRIRSSAVYWLGQVGGEQAFLADLVRNDAEDKKVRRQAAHAIGDSRDRTALTTLQTLYDSVKEPEIRRSIINAAGNNQDQDAAAIFLLKIARSDPDPELRKRAIRVIGEKGEPVVGDLIALYKSERTPDVRRTVLQSLGQIKSTRVDDKLFEIAKSDESLDLRRTAIRLLGERAGQRSLEFLSATAQTADGNTEVQIQAVRAISERKVDESVPILIKIAKTHGNQLVRRQAMRALGESGDPRAIEYFREVLAKE